MTRQDELQSENLKNETDAFNRVEERDRGRVEGEREEVALTWRGRSVSPTSEKLELTHPLSCYSRQDWRTKTSSGSWKLNAAQRQGQLELAYASDALPSLNFTALRNYAKTRRVDIRSLGPIPMQ